MKNLAKVLIISIPLCLVFSIFLLEVNLAVLSIYFLIKSFADRKFYYFNNFFFKLILIFSCYLVISFIFFQVNDIGYKYSFFLF